MIRHFFDVYDEISPTLKNRYVMLFLDYDGTLTPIVERPELAKLSYAAKKALKELARLKEIKIVLISGRSLSDLKKLVRIPGLIYVGNHGFEFEGPKIRYVHPGALAAKRHLSNLERRFKKAFRDFPGILVENKKLTLSVHYRQVEFEKIGQAKTIFLKLAAPYLQNSELSFTEGKKVWELRPETQWNKGTTVVWLLARVLFQVSGHPLPIYIGDDATDEDAFRTLRHKGIGIKVTEDSGETSQADYYLRSPDEVVQFLKHLKNLKKGAHAPKILVKSR